jgi:hypothetical protein
MESVLAELLRRLEMGGAQGDFRRLQPQLKAMQRTKKD